jgi:probable HAF family extracellular repeat protein
MADEPYFRMIGEPGAAEQNVWPRAVSADGSVVVGDIRSKQFGGNEGFRWTEAGGITTLGTFPGGERHATEAGAVSGDGTTIVGWASSPSHGYSWTLAKGFTDLGDLPGGGDSSRARAVSFDGSVIAGYSSSQRAFGEMFRWTAETGMVGLGFLPGFGGSNAAGISADGSVIAGTMNNSDRPVRWKQDEGFQLLGDLPGGLSGGAALAVSVNGDVLVGTSTSELGPEAFRWTESDGMIGLGDLPGGSFESRALAVSGDGAVIVGYSYTARGKEAFIWDEEHGMRGLLDVLRDEYSLPGLNYWHRFEEPTGITPDGRTIVGWGAHTFGGTRGWVVHVPEPSTLLLISIAMLLTAQGSCNGRGNSSAVCKSSGG